MIDTVVLNIYQNDFTILNHDRFSPSTLNLFEPPYIRVRKGVFKATNNPSKQDMIEHGYLPRVTCYKGIRNGGFKIWLRVEFSIPKLLNGNNFNEVDESDFEEVCNKLKNTMSIMGIAINDVNIIKSAEVSTIHYSKNIILTDYTTPSRYINEIKKCDISMFMDINDTNYRNSGHAFKYGSSSFSVIWYDKKKDLQQSRKSDKRAIEDDNFLQYGLFDVFNNLKPFEVLRLEVRINERKKIRSLIKNLGLGTDRMDFKTLFSSKISKKVLLSVLNKTEKNYLNVVECKSDSISELATTIQINNPELNYTQILKYIGAKAVIDEVGIRGFREMMDRFGDSQWYRFKKWADTVKTDKTVDVFKKIREDIEKFEMVKLDLFQN